MKRITILILIISHSGFLFGQDNNLFKSNQIKFSPLKIIDPINPGIELSFEKFYANRYSSQVSIGYMKSIFKTESFDNYNGIRISVEEKYFQKMNARHRTYVSTELVYLKVNYSTSALFVKDTALRTPAYGDSFSVSKQTMTANLKYGIQIPFFKNYIIDLSTGIGIKYKMAKRSGLLDENAYERTAIDPNIYDMANAEGNYLTFSLPVTVRVGFIF